MEEKINSGLPFGKYNATLYVEQVVEGMNYRMKVSIAYGSEIGRCTYTCALTLAYLCTYVSDHIIMLVKVP